MKSDRILLQGGNLYHPDGYFTRGDILLGNGTIEKIGKSIEEPSAKTVHLDGYKIVPGFIDIHIQGAGGADCLEGTEKALRTISQILPQEGTTSFLATTIMLPDKKNKHLPAIKHLTNTPLGGAHLLGIHLESPFISEEKKGGINPAAIGKPTTALFQKVQALCEDTLRIMTIAPEIEGNLDFIRQYRNQGIVPAFGHSNADYEQTLAGIEAGINHVTHMFNAMRPIHHREPGPLVALFDSPAVSAQLICDGRHIHPAVIKTAYRLLGKDRCILITDGMSGLGLGDGTYEYHGMKYISEDGTSRYLNGTLNGTTIGLAGHTRRFCRFTGCSLEEAIPMSTINPARLLGIDDRKGSIKEGKDADLVVLNEDNYVRTTFCNGAIAYSADDYK